MIENFVKNRIKQALPFTPNEGQEELLGLLAHFLVAQAAPNTHTSFSQKPTDNERHTFILRGYAGTGKTSIMAALVRAMHELKQPVVLLAPTGRAAKVY